MYKALMWSQWAMNIMIFVMTVLNRHAINEVCEYLKWWEKNFVKDRP